MAKKRSEIEPSDQWNVGSVYPHLEAWEKEFKDFAKEKISGVRWPAIEKMRGRIAEGPQRLKELLVTSFRLERKLLHLYAYAHLRHDEDVSNDIYKNAYDRVSLLYHDFLHETAWIQPEILQLSREALSNYLKDEACREYQVYLENLIALKPYTLSADKEDLMALAGRALDTPKKTFQIFNSGDLSFPPIRDAQGKQCELTHGTYSLYLQSEDRTLRKNAFSEFHRRYGAFENTLAQLISGQVQKHLFESTARGYPSPLHAALTVHHIDVEIYHHLISTVRENLFVLHRYVEVRKELMKVSSLHLYDLQVSLFPTCTKSYSFKEAQECVLASVEPLGAEYQQILQNGFNKQRWVDRYENVGKRSGAYSSGCYDSFPFILMNFQGTLRDVMTLAHEAGHSMHSFYSNREQPYHYANYPIFVAEVASTFNEELLFRYLLKRAKTTEEKAYLLNQKIDDIRSTFFRQTQFAEFELKLHQMGEEGIPLTPSTLKKEYRALNQAYYGPGLTIDPESDVEYLRIPHFYYNFYVYQYATGISAAHALTERLMQGGEDTLDDYLKFLSSGVSRSPLKLLQIAGVDMCQKEPIQVLIDHFSDLVEQLVSLS